MTNSLFDPTPAAFLPPVIPPPVGPGVAGLCFLCRHRPAETTISWLNSDGTWESHARLCLACQWGDIFDPDCPDELRVDDETQARIDAQVARVTAWIAAEDGADLWSAALDGPDAGTAWSGLPQ